MSEVEILHFLKKSLGVIIKLLEETGVRLEVFGDHSFSPEIVVTDKQVSLNVSGVVWKIKNLGDHPVFFNLDREVSSVEYGVVPPKSYVVVSRLANRVYLKAPEGQRCTIKVDALRWF